MNCYKVSFAQDELLPFEINTWNSIAPLEIDNFLPQSSIHHPVTFVRIRYSQTSISALFSVNDCFVISRRQKFQSDVWRDSCVEWFMEPVAGKGYFNFEMSCNGTLHVSYVEDSRRVNGQLQKETPLSVDDLNHIAIYHEIEATFPGEITYPIHYSVGIEIKFDLLKKYTGDFSLQSGSTIRSNFYKCADESSHPHLASWAPLTQKNFHLPDCFGSLQLI